MLDEQGKKLLVPNPEIKHPKAVYHINRFRYRKALGLSSKEMDEEPVDELDINQEIMKLDVLRAKIDNSVEQRKAAFAKQQQNQGKKYG